MNDMNLTMVKKWQCKAYELNDTDTHLQKFHLEVERTVRENFKFMNTRTYTHTHAYTNIREKKSSSWPLKKFAYTWLRDYTLCFIRMYVGRFTYAHFFLCCLFVSMLNILCVTFMAKD